MSGELTLNVLEFFVILVALAAAAALFVRRIGVPYTVVLVVLGLAAAIVNPGIEVEIPPELILSVFLPGLIFESGYRLDLRQLRRSSGAVFMLAVPGVIITAGVVAVILNLAAGIRLDLGFLIGAMLAATDPAAVIATIKRLRAPSELGTLIEAESLFNDGTAIVLFGLALTALGGGLSLAGGALTLLTTVVASFVIGGIGGFLASRLIARVDDHLIELSVTLVLAYGTYLIADLLHESGIIATVVAAIVLGSYGRARGMSERTQEAIDTVWEFAAFLLTAVLFLLIGLVISLPALVGAIWPIAWGIVAILVARGLVVYGLVGALSRLLPLRRLRRGPQRRPIPLGWQNVMIAAGLRGAVTVALALSLPITLIQRELIVEITFGVTLFTLVVQGLTLDAIVKRSLGHGDVTPPVADQTQRA